MGNGKAQRRNKKWTTHYNEAGEGSPRKGETLRFFSPEAGPSLLHREAFGFLLIFEKEMTRDTMVFVAHKASNCAIIPSGTQQKDDILPLPDRLFFKVCPPGISGNSRERPTLLGGAKTTKPSVRCAGLSPGGKERVMQCVPLARCQVIPQQVVVVIGGDVQFDGLVPANRGRHGVVDSDPQEAISRRL